MLRKWLPFISAFFATLLFVTICPAPGGGPPSIQDEVNNLREYVFGSDLIVVGKVRDISSKSVVASLKPNGMYRYEYKVATIAVQEVVMGPKSLSEVRLGFRVIVNPAFKKAEPQVGLEGCFMLSKHFEQDFYESIRIFKEDYPNYKRDLAQAKLAAKWMADPLASLKSKEFEDRLVASAMLINRYRNTYRRSIFGGFESNPVPPLGVPVKVDLVLTAAQTKQVPIDADESKLILSTLAEADWTANRQSTAPSPIRMFQQLGITSDDGIEFANAIVRPGFPIYFSPTPQNIAIAREWLKKNAENYRVKKFVIEEPPKQAEKK